LAAQRTYTGKAQTASGEVSKRQERATRILDAASELIQRWGYKKTAVDDIAKLAGVAKGTIYLHWKTREDLFAALMLREGIEAAREMQRLIDRDPEGVYLSNMSKHVVYVIMTRPLMRAIYLGDASVLGEFLHSGREDITLISQRKMLTNREMIIFYREHGLLRTDWSIEEQIKIYVAICLGFMSLNQYLPAEQHSTPEESVALLAMTVHEALEPAEPVAPAALQEARAMLNQVFAQFLQIFEEQLQKALA
jgi:AcrR family transcriptional regulator